MAESWANVPELESLAEHCAHCLSHDLIRVRSNRCRNGDIVRLHVCRRCSKRSRWRIKKVFPNGEHPVKVSHPLHINILEEQNHA
jgi:hypothetical protein